MNNNFIRRRNPLTLISPSTLTTKDYPGQYAFYYDLCEAIYRHTEDTATFDPLTFTEAHTEVAHMFYSTIVGRMRRQLPPDDLGTLAYPIDWDAPEEVIVARLVVIIAAYMSAASYGYFGPYPATTDEEKQPLSAPLLQAAVEDFCHYDLIIHRAVFKLRNLPITGKTTNTYSM